MRVCLLALPLSACASAPPAGNELDGLRSEVARLRAENAAQQRELERLRHEEAASAASSATVTARAEGATEVAPAAPQVPQNLKVVYVAPDPVVLEEPREPARAARVIRHRQATLAAAAPLPTATALREPVLGTPAAPPLSPEALTVAYTAALAAPDAAPLEAYARLHPDDPRADNALYEAGLRAERQGDPERAAQDFAAAVSEHPAGDVVADALLQLASCQLQLHRPDAARTTLARITRQFQGTPQAEAAAARLADLHD